MSALVFGIPFPQGGGLFFPSTMLELNSYSLCLEIPSTAQTKGLPLREQGMYPQRLFLCLLDCIFPLTKATWKGKWGQSDGLRDRCRATKEP